MTKNKKVLVFDDSVDILDLCTFIFEDMGCEVRTSVTSDEIEKQVSEFDPDLIFMDNWLPNISGIQATQMLKANEDLKHIPVIYFTANSNINELAVEAGADAFIAKPFDIEQLEKIAKQYLEQ